MSHQSHVKSYVAVYVTLLLLVIATVFVATVPLGLLAFPIALGIALSKMFLIMWIFMHVKDETPLVQIFAFLGIGWMGILFVFLFCDYFTRHNTVAAFPGQWHQSRMVAPHEGAESGHASHPKTNAEGHDHK